MKFVYQPKGAPPRSWDFAPDRLLNVEAEVIEKRTGWTYGEFMDKFAASSVLAIHALLYVLLKRSDPTLKWESVQFTLSEVDMVVDDNEAAEAIRTLREKETAGDLTDDESRALTELLAEHGEPAPKE